MPLDDIPQLDQLDSDLDDLGDTPTSLEVLEALLPYDGDLQAAAVGSRAIAGAAGGGGGGGPQPMIVLRMPIAFDTPGIIVEDGGIDIVTADYPDGYTTSIGDLIAVGGGATTQVWNGTDPACWVYLAGDDYATQHFEQPPNIAQGDSANGGGGSVQVRNPPLANSYLNRATAAAKLRVVIDDQAGGDPESSQGLGEVIIFIWPAS